MLTPEQLDHYPDGLVRLYAQAERDIIADMARRISTYDYFVPSAVWQYRKLAEMHNVHDDILKALTAQSGKTQSALLQMMKEAGEKSLSVDDAIYNKAGLATLPLGQSAALLATLDAGLKKTNGLFTNLTKTTANTATKQFEDALDRAYMQITTGAFDANRAIRQAITDLSKKGIQSIQYPSGHIDHLDVAVRRATLTGVNQTVLKMQEGRADEMGCDLVEVTAHAGARPAHAAWQGGVYSRSGQSSQYENFEYATGYGAGPGLGGWNCKHSWFPFFEGLSKRAYTQKDLADYNAKTINYNGKDLTEYEATQRQRYIERQLRRYKREYVGMKAAGESTTKATGMIGKWESIEKSFLKQTGLKRQVDRGRVFGYGRSEAGKVAGFVKKEVNTNELKVYSEKEIRKMSAAADKLIDQHIPGKSKWSGKTVVLQGKGHESGGKDWNCDILVRNKTADHVLIHEHLHARSVSYFTPTKYIEHQAIEEAAVDFLAQEICKKEGFLIADSAYMKWTNDLRNLNKMAGLYETDYKFAIELFGVDMDKRVDWLYNQISQNTGKLTIGKMQEINAVLEQF